MFLEDHVYCYFKMKLLLHYVRFMEYIFNTMRVLELLEFYSTFKLTD